MAQIHFQKPVVLVKFIGKDFKAHSLSPKVVFETGKVYLLDKRQGTKLLRKRGDLFLALDVGKLSIDIDDTDDIDDAEPAESINPIGINSIEPVAGGQSINIDDYLDS